MTLVFNFLDFSTLLFIIPIISSLLAIASNLFIIKSGKNQPPEVNASKNLIYSGMINIFFIVLSYLIPNLRSFHSAPPSFALIDFIY